MLGSRDGVEGVRAVESDEDDVRGWEGSEDVGDRRWWRCQIRRESHCELDLILQCYRDSRVNKSWPMEREMS